MRWFLTFAFICLLTGTAVAQPVNAPCAAPAAACLNGGPPSASSMTYGVLTNGTLTVLPVNAKLLRIYVANTTANAVTGGINIGTTSGGSDVASAVAVGANGLVTIAGSALLKNWFSTTLQQTLYISAVSAWNSASLTVELVWDQ